MEIRPTATADLPAQYAVFRAAIGGLYRRHAFPPPEPPQEAFVAQQGHLLAHDADRCFVAEEDGRVVAYTAAFERGDAWFLSSLFVLPEFQGRGIGARLLERAWNERAPRRLTLTDAIQPVSNNLYARRGLVPATPMLALEGTGRTDAPLHLEPATVDAVALRALDESAYGFERTVDHRFWARGGEATLWLRGGEPVAYSYVWPHGRIGPVAGADAEFAALALRAELGRREGDRVDVVAPGSSAALVTAAVAAGLRMARPPGLLLASHPSRLPDALAISSYSLF
ncbi:MAG: GNAT family N-acetyltransferase [Gaiellaceae bacterium]